MNGSSPRDGKPDLDLLLLEALSYHGPLTSTRLIGVAVAAGVSSDDAQRWLLSASERGLIHRSLSDSPEQVWTIS